MRFLFGLFTGAVLTLLVATAMDAPTSPVVNGARDLATDAWDQLIARTSDSLFEPPAVVSDGSDRMDVIEAAATPAAVVSALPENDAEEPALVEPAPALPAPEPIDELPSSGYWADHAGTLESVLATAAAMDTTAASPVWVPFHSQMSAEGFATRLSQALDREFRVERQAPGAYQVVFDAADPTERDLILDRISEITGR